MYVATDLHGHTRFSDARTTPEEYVAFRHGLGMRVVAIADHDMMAGVRRGAAAARALGMVLVPAMETTSFVHFGQSEAEQIHVLAYYPPSLLDGDGLECTALYQRGLLVQKRWRAFILNWIDGLHPDDQVALDAEGELPKLGAGEFPGLQILIDRIVKCRPCVFRAFIKHHVRFWTEDRELFGWSPEELIDAIRQDGAVDVVAHPARYRDKERLARILLGATGVEVYTSRHRAEWAARFRAFAEEYGKLWTASSDDHQNAAYARPPCGTPVEALERIIQDEVSSLP